jgi:hypothetical protein
VRADLRPLVEAIVRRGFAEPAIFMLEMCKPLVGCLREAYALSEPMVQIFVGPSLAASMKAALASSDDTECLISLLEASRAAT